MYLNENIVKITAKENDTNDNRSYRNVCNMSFVSFSLAVIFIIRLFRTSAFCVSMEIWTVKSFHQWNNVLSSQIVCEIRMIFKIWWYVDRAMWQRPSWGFLWPWESVFPKNCQHHCSHHCKSMQVIAASKHTLVCNRFCNLRSFTLLCKIS